MAEFRTYTAEELIQQEKDFNPAFAQAWDDAAAARNVRLAIIDARMKAGLTQAQLAEKLGVKQSVVARYETGKHDLRLSTLQRIVAVTGQAVHIVVEPPTLLKAG